MKRWYRLPNEPNMEFFGALDAGGNVVVEHRRYIVPPRSPARLLPPYLLQGAPYVGSCSSGRCGSAWSSPGGFF